MKKTYEKAEVNVFLFDHKDMLVASADVQYYYIPDEDDLPVLRPNIL